jgi:hypothetical protein
MPEGSITFKRIFYGMQVDGKPWLATIIDNILIPDFELVLCSKKELQIHYDWKIITIATYIRGNIKVRGTYEMDLGTREIREKEF